MNTSNPMDVEGVKETLVKLMAIADRLDARNLQTAQQFEAAAVTLDQAANRLSEGGDEFAQRALGVIRANVQQSIVQGTETAVDQVRGRLELATTSAQAAARVMEREAQSLTNARRTLVWNGMIALLVGSLLAAGGAAWIAHKSMQEVAQANFAKDILQATRTGAITRCGDVLCARVGAKPRRYGTQGEYVMLQ